jgi:hypothetical protein
MTNDEKKLAANLEKGESKVEFFNERLEKAELGLMDAQAALLASDEGNEKSFANLVGNVRDRIGDVDVIKSMQEAAVRQRDAAHVELLKYHASVAQTAAKKAGDEVRKNRAALGEMLAERRILMNTGRRDLEDVDIFKRRIDLDTRIAALKINGEMVERESRRARLTWDRAREDLTALVSAAG